MPRKKFPTFVGNNLNLTIAQAQKRYASLLTLSEKKSLSDEAVDNFIRIENNLDKLMHDENLRRKKFIGFWFQCLRLNEDYKKYCSAKETSTQKVIDDLNKTYPSSGNCNGVAKLYEDWGCIEDKKFDVWFKERETLFLYPSKTIEEVISPSPKFGHLLVSLPKGIEDKEELRRLFNKFYSGQYKDYKSYKPKYVLSCKPTMEKLSMMNLSMFVHDLREYEYMPDDDPIKEAEKFKNMSKKEEAFLKSNYSQAQLVQTIMADPALRYEFSLDEAWMVNDPIQRKLLLSRELSNADIVKRKLPYIKKLEKYASSCIRVSITGKFPA